MSRINESAGSWFLLVYSLVQNSAIWQRQSFSFLYGFPMYFLYAARSNGFSLSGSRCADDPSWYSGQYGRHRRRLFNASCLRAATSRMVSAGALLDTSTGRSVLR